MIQHIELTQGMLLRGRTREKAPPDELRLVLVRLLSLALAAVSGGRRPSSGPCLPIPSGYRQWPHLELHTEESVLQRRLRLYVCPKAAATTADEHFPVGTVVVAERVRSGGRFDARPLSIFVMAKASMVRTHVGSCGSLDGWAYAMYRPTGRAMDHLSAASGLCRLAVGQT